MQKLIYTSTQKRTKTTAGETKVSLDVDGTVTELGTVIQAPSSKTFSALMLDGTFLGDTHATKKQAGGALKKHNDAGENTEAPVEQEVTKPENVIEVPEPIDTDEPEDEDEGGDETNEPDAVDLEWLDPVDQDEDFFDIPKFLDRRIGLAEEM